MNEERKSLEEKAQKLAKSTEDALRGANWRILITTLIDDAPFTDGALAASAGLLALMIPNLKDLLGVIAILPLKVGVGLILTSAILGLLSKALRKSVHASIANESPGGKEIIAIIGKHKIDFSVLAEEAKRLGFELKDSTDYAQMLGPTLEKYPVVGKKVIKNALSDDSSEQRWRSAHRKATLCSKFVFFQGYLLAVAIVVLLIYLKEPNQAPEPTPTSVTPPAGQEARQP